ncbi:MAG: KH domain-containing protein [Clostridia bacterium]|nr:KH domain-containing protein [Clostridia bacterium]
MIKEAIGTGLTIDEARENAALKLGVGEDADVQFEVVTFPKKKTLGLFGGCKAEVKAFIELPDEKPKKKQEKKANKPIEKKAENKKAEPKKAEAKDEPKKAEKKNDADKEYGPVVDASELPADSRPAKAIEFLKPILKNLGCENVSFKVAQRENAALIELEGEGLGAIIGHRGETLDALQFLAGLASNNGSGYYKVSLNIGNYREKREDTLIALANRIAQQVLKTGKCRTLEPMNPYERRIIHTAVQAIDGVTSASFGEGINRRVVIGKEGTELKPLRNDRSHGRRDDRRRGGRRPSNKVEVAPNRAPKKDSDIPLYGKIN